MPSGAFWISFLIVTGVVLCQGNGDEDQCLNSRHHKDSPSPETNFQECTSWEKRSCCNVNISTSIHLHQAKNLYNYHWDKCGSLSSLCERFIINEECFYQCEPRLIKFKKADTNGYITGVPVCATYCQSWFDACKDDMTCVEDWLGHWDYDEDDGENHCPKNSSCITFADMYKNAKGLCDKMWGEAFFYEETDNCMVMAFDKTGENPNSLVTPLKDSATDYRAMSISTKVTIIGSYVSLGFLRHVNPY